MWLLLEPAVVVRLGLVKFLQCVLKSYLIQIPSVMKIISCIGVFAFNRISKSSHAYVYIFISIFLGSVLIL